eukprot:6211244-Pleurochrysis_carterae.AAC.3
MPDSTNEVQADSTKEVQARRTQTLAQAGSFRLRHGKIGLFAQTIMDSLEPSTLVRELCSTRCITHAYLVQYGHGQRIYGLCIFGYPPVSLHTVIKQ